jgi:hypothetical protein
MVMAGMQENVIAETEAFMLTFTFSATGIPLCDAARRFFSADTLTALGYPDADSPTLLRMSKNDLSFQFAEAIREYNALNPEDVSKHAYTSVAPPSTLDALNWVASEEGLLSQYGIADWPSQNMVFNSPEDAARMTGQFGTEPALRDAIVAFSERTGRRLTPGDVFYLALQQTGGDTRQATLLAHNTLRSLARPGDNLLTGVSVNRAFFTTYLATLRGTPGAETSADSYDNSGPWYHLFGTAYFEIEANQNATIFPALVGLLEMPRELVQSLLNGYLPDFGLIADEPTNYSRLANAIEQLQRWKAGSDADPEKFCVNIWGAELGREIFYGHAPNHPWGPIGARKPSKPAAPTDEQRQRSESLQQIAPAVSESSLELFAPETFAEPNVPWWSIGSPVNVTWSGADGTLILDQSTGGLYGSFPILPIPFYDEEERTWGLLALDSSSQPYELTFEGTAEGTLHISRVDPASGQIGTWIADVHAGEQLNLSVAPGVIDMPLTRGDGSIVAPIVNQLDNGASTVAPTPTGADEPVDQTGGTVDTSSDSGLDPMTVLGVGAVALVAIVLLVALVRRSRKPSDMAPLAPASATAPAGTPRQSRRKPVASPAVTTRTPLPPPPVALVTPASGEAHCATCGATMSSDALFCGTCGAKIERAIPVETHGAFTQPVALFCAQCGARLMPDSRYCAACGARVVVGSQEAVATR